MCACMMCGVCMIYVFFSACVQLQKLVGLPRPYNAAYFSQAFLLLFILQIYNYNMRIMCASDTQSASQYIEYTENSGHDSIKVVIVIIIII